jgi:DHA2 family metal-tetracycline-proton antiporter-like MFS transporter
MGSVGLVLPLIAVFLSGSILYGNIVAAGVGVTIYGLIKSVFRIPLSKYCDIKGLHKQFMIIGYFIMAIIPLGYYFMNNIYQYYALQVLSGVGIAIGRAGWYGIFSRNIEKNQEAYTWGVIQTAIGLTESLTAAIAGIVVTYLGFHILFLLAAILSQISVIVLLKIEA